MAPSPKREAVCPLGGRLFFPREQQGVLTEEFLGMMGQGHCSSQVWEHGPHAVK